MRPHTRKLKLKKLNAGNNTITTAPADLTMSIAIDYLLRSLAFIKALYDLTKGFYLLSMIW